MSWAKLNKGSRVSSLAPSSFSPCRADLRYEAALRDLASELQEKDTWIRDTVVGQTCRSISMGPPIPGGFHKDQKAHADLVFTIFKNSDMP